MSLSGKSLFVTGASRGIGLAIAPRDAKPVEAHPRLPGAIYTAAAEIEAAVDQSAPAHIPPPPGVKTGDGSLPPA